MEKSKLEILEILKYELYTAIKYTALAEEKAKAGNKGGAIYFLDIAQVAYECACKRSRKENIKMYNTDLIYEEIERVYEIIKN